MIAAALILPGYIDWNRFKSGIETHAGNMVGRRVFIAGGIHFALLPRPALSLEKITLPHAGGGNGAALLSLERLELRLSVLPLLSGDIQIEQFRLIAPSLSLVRGKDGRGNWPLEAADMAGGASKIRFDRISIEQGSLRYRDAVSGADFALEQMELQFSAESLHGPLTANGALRMQGVPIRFDASLGALDMTPAQSPAPLRINASLNGEGEITYAGNVNAGLNAKGTLRAVGKDMNHLAGSLARLSGLPAMQGGRIFAHPYSMESDIVIDANTLEFNKARLKLAEETLTANLKFERGGAGKFSLVLDSPSINLDALLAGDTADISGKTSAPQDTSESQALPDQWPVLEGSARFNAGDLQWKGGHIRNAALTLLLSGNEIRVANLSAQLPGTSSANLSGVILAGESSPQFTGKVNLQTANLRGLAGWLGADLQILQDRSLAHGALTADFLLTPYQAEFQEIAAEIDSSKLTGALAFAFRDRPAIGADLRIDAFNADNYLPQDASAPETAPPPPSMKFSLLRSWIDCCDYNLKLALDKAGYRGTPVENLRLEAGLLSGALVINHFTIANIAGSAVGLSGILSKITTRAEGEINFRLASRNLGVMAQWAGLELPLAGAGLGAAEIGAKLLVADRAAEIKLDSMFEGTFLRLSGKLSGLGPDLFAPFTDDTLFVSQVSLGSQSLGKFAAQFGLPLTPSPEADAAGVGLAGVLVRAPQEISLNVLSGAIGGVPIQARGVLRLDGARPVLLADIAAGEIIAGKYFSEPSDGTSAAPVRGALPWSGAPLDPGYLNEADVDVSIQAARLVSGGYDITKPALNFAAHDGHLSISSFNGALFDGTFRAGASLNLRAPVPEFSADWKIQDGQMEAASAALTGAPVFTGKFDFSGGVKGAGVSTFAIVSALEGKALLNTSDGVIRRLDLPNFSKKLGEIQRAGDFQNLAAPLLEQGGTPYRKMEIPFIIAQGVAQPQNPVLDIAAVSSNLRISLDFPRYWLDAEAALSLLDHKDAPPIVFSYTGPLDQPVFSRRYDQLENHLTQPLISQSLERVINSRTAPAAAPAGPYAGTSPAPPAPQASPPAAAPPPDTRKEVQNPARKMLDGLLNGILDGDD